MTCFSLRQMPKHQRKQSGHARMPEDVPPRIMKTITSTGPARLHPPDRAAKAHQQAETARRWDALAWNRLATASVLTAAPPCRHVSYDDTDHRTSSTNEMLHSGLFQMFLNPTATGTIYSSETHTHTLTSDLNFISFRLGSSRRRCLTPNVRACNLSV